jgi:hypothetical protein
MKKQGGLLIVALVCLTVSCSVKPKDYIPTKWKDFEDLSLMDRVHMQYDSVFGNYLKWSGKNDTLNTSCELVFDKPDKFALKVMHHDTTGLFTKIPGNINSSGQWIEKEGKLLLKFYFDVKPSWPFDSLKNEGVVRIINPHTVEINKNAETIWMLGAACVKKR